MTHFLGCNAFAETFSFLVFLLLDTTLICVTVTTSLLGRMFFPELAFLALFLM